MRIGLSRKAEPERPEPKYPGIRDAVDGSTATVLMETAASEAAGAYPITPSTQMGEGWAAAYAEGRPNAFGRRLLFFEPEGEHAAAAVTAGMSMVGLRAANFSSGQGIVYMHESLYPAVGKRLTYVLNMACRAITKHALSIHAAHDDYHAVDDTGFFQLFAKNVQEVADLTLIAHRIAELSLNPGICAQDGFLTSHVIESVLLPERELVKEYLGDPSDLIESPTPAQRLVFGEKRRRIPEMFDLDYPAMFGVVQNQESYAQGVAAQRPFYFDHVAELADCAFAEFAALTGRMYARASGYRLEDAEYVIAGQGSVVANAEAVADHLRAARGLRVGVLNLTMFRPFPADLVTRMLAGKKGVTVFERVDQPLAVEPPLLREIRAAMSQAVENGRARGPLFYPTLPALTPDKVPDFYSACFGLGSLDLQPGEMIAAVENMLEGARGRRRFYLGLDFIREGTRLPKLQIWQEQVADAYPEVAELALRSAGELNLLPEGSISFRIHSVGGWGAITMGKNLCLTAFELLGLHVKANPKYSSEKKGQPTTFYGTLSREAVRLNCELKHVDVVLSPDGNVFRHSNPLEGLAAGGAFVIQSDAGGPALWESLPASARREIRERGLKVFALDAFRIASDEATDPELRYRMQGAAFMGAFFRVSPLMEREGLDETRLFEGIRAQLNKKFGHLGERVVADNLRVIRRGFDEVRAVEVPEASGEEVGALPVPKIPALMDVPTARDGIGNPGRFWEQVCFLCKTGQDVIADPSTAIGAIPAATSSIRDMTDIRFEVPDFIAARCTGCAHCWTQCPDAAIPGVVNTVEEVIDAAIAAVAADGGTSERVRQIAKPLARECRRILKGVPFTTFADTLSSAYKSVVEKLGWDPERRAALGAEFGAVYAALAEFPLAKTAPFFDAPEKREAGAGALLSITVNPEACKGCNLCVAVCPEGALVTLKQDEEVVERLRRNWKLWQRLPDTNDRYVNIASLEEGIGVLSSLLLKKGNYRSMVGGDGACMGCGEKTTVHLVVAAIHALMGPRVKKYVARLDELIAGLDRKARALLASDADLDAAAGTAAGTAPASSTVVVPLGAAKRQRVERISKLISRLKDLRWRYVEGPSGKGRAALGMANSTGCSTVWGSTYPYNPYPFPWVNHLFQDSPSVAIGIFEGHMRKMADGFLDVRRSQLELEDAYDPAVHEPAFSSFDWRQFTDGEFALCPPILSMGGDGAMLDIGFQNLSRLLASGKPIRVMVLDTQVYSNTGGQACTSGFTGQISDMAAYGAARHGKEEVRKELALIAVAHRGVFVHQSSQASASHLLAGVLRGLQARRPALFNIYTPCPVEHGLADDAAEHAARLALESRAFPFLTYDPDAGSTFADSLNLDGNPAPDQEWPSYELRYVDEAGEARTMELPLTIADWAATEGRFKKHFKRVPREQWNEDMVPFHEFLTLAVEERAGKVPFIHTIDGEKRLERLRVSSEIVRLAQERLLFWSQLRQLAGLEVAPGVRDAVAGELDAEFERKAEAIRAEYEAKLADLRARYPMLVARKLAEGLVRAGTSGQTVGELLARVQAIPDMAPLPALSLPTDGGPARAVPAGTAAAALTAAVAGAVAVAAPAAAPGSAETEEALALEPYIDSALCTTCNECTNLNAKMFAYNESKQAYIKDPRAGTFRELVMAAEKCPVGIIHPGTPLNAREKDLDKWIKRAERFN
ncbi:MAG: 2-oxoacid:acceptor oxidoreductase family protein [Gemmatimonadetes bacterium]|nr:2-oxoacid:acceptor oxidoreductase family protein [Gemmatimonadota bacterium]